MFKKREERIREMNKKNRKGKRDRFVQKLWYVLLPFLIYTVAKTFAMLTLSMLISSIPSQTGQLWIQEHEYMLSAVINAVASIIGVAFIVKDFLIEVAVTGEINIDKNVFSQFGEWISCGISHIKEKVLELIGVAIVGVISAFSLNYLLTLLPITSVKYDEVEQIQYSVPIWLGLILYGLVSPIVEEIVFRGLTYNRMRRFFKHVPSILVSAILFGGFHANLPQFLYATTMGIFMTVCYDKVKSFSAPVVFHMAANIFIFISSSI